MTPAFQNIVKRDGTLAPFNVEKITVAIYKAAAAVGGHDRALSERLSRQVVEALSIPYSESEPPTVEDIQDLVERTLIKNGFADTAKAYILYRHERARMRKSRDEHKLELVPYKAMWHALDWAVEHECETVAKLNALVRAGRQQQLIEKSEERYEGILDAAARAILERRNDLRFVIVAGPSSSGKTTTTLKLSERLEREGISVIPMALDNYFFDLEKHPKDASGDYDFETPEAMDLPLLNEQLATLNRGDAIEMPTYDFKLGLRTPRTTRFAPSSSSLILLDTLHGLYDGLTASVPEERKFRIYIETISQLKTPEGRYVRWTDIRLLRRMIRDSMHRSYSPERTILHWHYVRRSELKHIIPHQSRADFVVNSSLAYELPVLKKRLFHFFPEFLKKWGKDEKRVEEVIRAERIHRLLDSLAAIEDDALIPQGSLLREFIGGSSYAVH
ncbi:MAG TPA: ATP cone domain-containing protein [bacterium]|nr:ATP cone domain-containing protein [bacterium]